MLKKIIIVGTGGHANSLSGVALSCGYDVEAYVADASKKPELHHGAPIISFNEALNREECFLAIAVGDNFSRAKVASNYLQHFTQSRFPSLVHPSSVVDPSCEVAYGSVVMPLAVIGPKTRVGAFCIINTKASLDHDCDMRDYASLAPGTTLSGGVTIGSRSAICVGASVRHNTSIGEDVVVGANSYVHKSLPDNALAWGTPARVVLTRDPADPYL